MNKRHIKIRPDDVRSATMFPAAGNTEGGSPCFAENPPAGAGKSQSGHF